MLEFVWDAIKEVIKAINCLNSHVRYWREVVGAFEVLQEDHELEDLCSGLNGIMWTVDGLGNKYAALVTKFEDLEVDNVKNLTHLNDKIKRLIDNLVMPAPSLSGSHAAPVTALCVTTPILDGHGSQVGLLGCDGWYHIPDGGQQEVARAREEVVAQQLLMVNPS